MLANFFMDDTIFSEDDDQCQVQEGEDDHDGKTISSVSEAEKSYEDDDKATDITDAYIKEHACSSASHTDKEACPEAKHETNTSSGWLDSWRQYWDHNARKQSEFKVHVKERWALASCGHAEALH